MDSVGIILTLLALVFVSWVIWASLRALRNFINDFWSNS